MSTEVRQTVHRQNYLMILTINCGKFDGSLIFVQAKSTYYPAILIVTARFHHAWKATGFWEGLIRQGVCMPGKSKSTNTDKVTFFYAFVPHLPMSSILRACLFPLIRRLALRGDATPTDYSAYSCCDALFIIFLAALLDWHLGLENSTTALYSWTSRLPSLWIHTC